MYDLCVALAVLVTVTMPNPVPRVYASIHRFTPGLLHRDIGT